VAVVRRQSVCVPVERNFTAKEVRFTQSLGASSFGVFPVVVGTRLVGCFYCDRSWNALLPDRPTLSFARRRCEGAVKGMEARQAITTPGRPTSAAGVQAVIRATPAYCATFKRDTVLRIPRGKDATAVSAGLGIPERVPQRWKREFLAGARAGMRTG